ncbi:TIGR02647 family protein [Gammaproteobacteria bacterium AS21]|jgi:uncharacterized protein (TIGR02647 family)
MKINDLLVNELTLLSQFKSQTALEGIKVHANASQDMVDAASRLFEKNLITKNDGGYLTDLGKEAAENLDSLMSILTTPSNLDTSH